MAGFHRRSKEEREREKRIKEQDKKVIEINLKAQELGMSYGQYMAMKYIEEERAKREASKKKKRGRPRKVKK